MAVIQKRSSLKWQILFAAGTLLTVIMLIVLTFAGITSYRNATRLAEVKAQQIAEQYGKQVLTELEKAVEVGRTVASVLGANSKDKQIGREQVAEIIGSVHRANPSFQGVYTYWDPNTFDLRNETAGTPLQCWWYTENGKRVRSAPDAYTPDWGGEDWYIRPKKEKKPIVLDPYVDSDIKILMLSSTTPVLQDGLFQGMVGIDLAISYMQELADSADIYNRRGKLGIISNNGTICGFTGGVKMVKDGEEERMPLVTEQFALGDTALKHISEGKGFTFKEKKMISFSIPLNISQGVSQWAVMVQVPRSVVFAQANAVMRTLIILGGIVILLGLYLLSLLINKMIEPLERVVSQCGNVAEGNLSEDMSEADRARRDEVGNLARSFQDVIVSLREKVTVAKTIASGELDFEVHPASEHDDLGFALEEMRKALGEMVATISETAESLKNGTIEIADAGQALSEGATESAASVEEISASLHDIENQIKEGADTSSEVDRRTVQASHDAEKCNVQMKELTTTMSEIAEETTKISKIIKTIDDIAFQTNLLALNAAVEAARAGQHGKGFAVVADEVRNLANRSAKAAQETDVLINQGLSRVTEGETLTNATAESLQTIVDNTKEVSTLITGMSEAADDQALGITQITEGLKQIETATQNTTAHAEETASAIQELEDIAIKLSRIVARFHVKHRNVLDNENQRVSLPPVQEKVVKPHNTTWGGKHSADFGGY